MSKRIPLLSLLLAAFLASAGCGNGSVGKQPAIVQPASSAEQRPLGVTGVPIDPAKKTVLVVNAPSQAVSPQQSMSQLQSEQQKTEAKLAKLMKSYSGNINNAKTKDKLTKEMSGQLEDYKRQSLELYRLQRAQRQVASSE